MAEIEYKWCTREKLFKVIEVNIRPCRLEGLASASGINLVYGSFMDLAECKTNGYSQQVNGVKWLFPARDVIAITKGIANKRLSVKDVIASYVGPKTWCIWAKDDIKPFFAYFGEMFFKIMKLISAKVDRNSSRSQH